MLRRPATVILLTEEDVNTHLERILLARSSLPVNIDALSLDDEDQKSVIRDDKADQIAPPSLNTMTASSSSSSSTAAGMCPASNVFPASLMRVRGLTHHAIAANSVNPNGAVPTANAAAQLISTHFPQTALATQLSAGSSSPSRTELTIPPQEFLDHHILPSPTSKQDMYPRRHQARNAGSNAHPDQAHYSPDPSPRLAPTPTPTRTSPGPTSDHVPLRTLDLASSTRSAEVDLIEMETSSAPAAHH